VDGPHGALTVDGRDATGLVLIAGGLGVAPIMSILRQARATRDPRPLKLIYGNRLRSQVLFEEELGAMSAELDFEVIHVLGEPPVGWQGLEGQLDPSVLTSCLPEADRASWLYVVCGPPPMIESVEGALSALGIPRNRVLSEKFSYD
jgi:ferredoxin-NADP reductase